MLSNRGYDGAAADVWSCGVVLYVLMAGYLPFDEADLHTLYTKVRCSNHTFVMFEMESINDFLLVLIQLQVLMINYGSYEGQCWFFSVLAI